jgi:hypothetical protein
VIKKGNTSIDISFPSAIKIQRHSDFGFASFAVDFGNARSIVGHSAEELIKVVKFQLYYTLTLNCNRGLI